MSRLRAKCPDCCTLTAVALGGEYECHSCGRVFGAGLVRVPRAWGQGGEPMAEAAFLPLPYPETAVVEEDSLAEQTLALAADLPDRPLVLGGCCCVHVGAIEGLAARSDRLAVVWLDAHGDLNTPSTSPSGNAWGMPLRMLLDDGAVLVEDALLLGARNLDPAEEVFIASSGLATDLDDLPRVLGGADAVYVALDVDVLEPDGEVTMFMPEPDGPDLAETEAVLARIAASTPVAGLGFTGLTAAFENAAPLVRLAAALGL
jgi:arginase